MTWTTQKPTKPGYWWWKGHPELSALIVEIVQVQGHLEVCEDWWQRDYSDLAGIWSSEPIPEPEEQP